MLGSGFRVAVGSTYLDPKVYIKKSYEGLLERKVS